MNSKIHLTADDGWGTKDFYLVITEEQKALLNWLTDEVFGDAVSWEVIDEEEVIDLTKGSGD